MNTSILSDTYAPLGSVEIKGIRLAAFDNSRIIAEHDLMVFDQQFNHDISNTWRLFPAKNGMKLHYNDLTIEWLGKTAPMDSLSNPDIAAREVESYLYYMDHEDEGPDTLEYAYISPILDAKYGNVDIGEIIKDNCSHLDPGK